MNHQVAIVMSEVFLRRLTPSLTPFVRRQQDYRIVSIHRPMHELRALIEKLNPAGLITEWLPETTEAMLSLDLDIPTVIVDTDLCYPGVVSIDVDDWAVGRSAAETFLKSGYRSFACLGNGSPYSDQRIEGFCEALGANSPDQSVACEVRHETGFEDARYSESFVHPSRELEGWLESLEKPVGVFAVHDPLGRFLCGASLRIGLDVPGEVAVIGANNDELVCGLTYPMLSSVAIPWDAIGGAAGDAMQHLIQGGKVDGTKARLVPPSGVIMRHSANHFAIEDPLLRRAMSFLSERLSDPIDIAQLCRELRVARRTLERRFREHYRCTPWEMLCQLRVDRAKRLLAETNHPVSMISELCGFNDPERMAVVFKRITGEAPTLFRKSTLVR
ncbi:MAG: substrate-binding domain-containing protein [Verrucomicrobiota bacterium]